MACLFFSDAGTARLFSVAKKERFITNTKEEGLVIGIEKAITAPKKISIEGNDS